jgi:hypothetical protein
MDGEVPFTNLLGCNHHWPLCPALTLTRLTVTGLTLISIIMRALINLFPLTRAIACWRRMRTNALPDVPWRYGQAPGP